MSKIRKSNIEKLQEYRDDEKEIHDKQLKAVEPILSAIENVEKGFKKTMELLSHQFTELYLIKDKGYNVMLYYESVLKVIINQGDDENSKNTKYPLESGRNYYSFHLINEFIKQAPYTAKIVFTEFLSGKIFSKIIEERELLARYVFEDGELVDEIESNIEIENTDFERVSKFITELA